MAAWAARLRPYRAFVRMRFALLVTYRWAAAAGIMTQWVFGLAKIMVLTAFYGFSPDVGSISLAQSITYVWIGQAMLGFLPWNTDSEILQSVRTGQVAYELARPLDIYSMWYARCIALRVGPTLLKSVPQFIISAFLVSPHLRMQLPGPAGAASWLAAILGALMLSCAITNILHASLFWTVTGEGLLRILPATMLVLSGMMVPLPLLPQWMQTLLRYQPFAGLVDLPTRLFCGSLPPADVWQVLALQAFWTAALVLLGRYILARGLQRLEVAGG